MARKARVVIPGQPMYVVAKGIESRQIFIQDELKLALLAWLRDVAKKYQLAIHAYVILPNQLQLILTPQESNSISRAMQSLCRRYTQLFNQKNHTVGSIWSGRFSSSLITTDNDLLQLQRKLERSPVEQGLSNWPEDYYWSSYRIHTGIEPNYGLNDAIAFWNLGNTPFERQKRWEEFVHGSGEKNQ